MRRLHSAAVRRTPLMAALHTTPIRRCDSARPSDAPPRVAPVQDPELKVSVRFKTGEWQHGDAQTKAPKSPADDVVVGFVKKMVKSSPQPLATVERLLPTLMRRAVTQRHGGNLMALLLTPAAETAGLVVDEADCIHIHTGERPAARPAPALPLSAASAPPARAAPKMPPLPAGLPRPAGLPSPAATKATPVPAKKTTPTEAPTVSFVPTQTAKLSVAPAEVSTLLDGARANAAFIKPAKPAKEADLSNLRKPGSFSQSAPSQFTPRAKAPSAPALPSLPGLPGDSRGAGAPPPGMQFGNANEFQARSWRSPAEVVDTLMDYVPSYWIHAKHVHFALPNEVKEMYNERLRLNQFLKKFPFFFDTKVTLKGAEIKVKADCRHAKKGDADDRYADSLRSSEAVVGAAAAEVIDTTTLVGKLRTLVPKAFIPVKEFEVGMPTEVETHASYDANAGVAAVFNEHPQFFQVADGAVRLRPWGVAPNALSALSETDSPAPDLLRTLLAQLPEIDSRTLAPPQGVGVAALFAALTAEQMKEVKALSKSLPRFLRQHGRLVIVSQDNLTVARFREDRPEEAEPEPEEVIVGMRLPDEGSMTEASGAEMALRELYEAMPWTQAVELDDIVTMLPPAIRGLLADVDLAAELEKYPSYFTTWPYPDDVSVTIVQRAKVDTPEMPDDELALALQYLIPQGGIDAERLMRKVPVHVQRYLYRHGIRTVLGRITKHFYVSDDRILRIS
jgi:hypothetical protein